MNYENCKLCPRSAVCAAAPGGLGYAFDSCYHRCLHCGVLWWIRFTGGVDAPVLWDFEHGLAPTFTPYTRRRLPFWVGFCENCLACTQPKVQQRKEPIYTIGSGKAFYVAGRADEDPTSYFIRPTRATGLVIELVGMRVDVADPSRGLMVTSYGAKIDLGR